MEMTIDVEQWFYYAMDVLNGIVHSYRGNRDKNKHKEQSPTNCTMNFEGAANWYNDIFY
jgi:hypothetical protein